MFEFCRLPIYELRAYECLKRNKPLGSRLVIKFMNLLK